MQDPTDLQSVAIDRSATYPDAHEPSQQDPARNNYQEAYCLRQSRKEGRLTTFLSYHKRPLTEKQRLQDAILGAGQGENSPLQVRRRPLERLERLQQLAPQFC